MTKTQGEAKEVVRKIIKADIVDEYMDQTLEFNGEHVHISTDDDKGVRFSLIDKRISFVLMSGRLFQRDYVDPHFAKQRNYHGLVEEVDTRRFINRIECACGEFRWVKNADLFQVKKCKPCTYRDRKERRKLRRSNHG